MFLLLCSYLRSILFLYRFALTTPSGEQYADKEDYPANSHNEPEGALQAQEASKTPGHSIENSACQDQNIGPEQIGSV
jgi:hypothetical protein